MKIFNKSLLCILLMSFLSYCGRGLTSNWHEQVIQHYLNEELDWPQSYQKLDFVIIDKNYLENQTAIHTSISYLHSKYHDLFKLAAVKQHPPLGLDTLNIYQKTFKDLKLVDINVKQLKDDINQELDFLNSLLQTYNLSIHKPLPTDSLIVYHEYLAENSLGRFKRQSIFEIATEEKYVLSEKILNQSEML